MKDRHSLHLAENRLGASPEPSCIAFCTEGRRGSCSATHSIANDPVPRICSVCCGGGMAMEVLSASRRVLDPALLSIGRVASDPRNFDTLPSDQQRAMCAAIHASKSSCENRTDRPTFSGLMNSPLRRRSCNVVLDIFNLFNISSIVINTFTSSHFVEHIYTTTRDSISIIK